MFYFKVLAAVLIGLSNKSAVASTGRPPCTIFRVSAIPDVSEKFYFQRGDMIKFKIVAYNNQSVPEIEIEDANLMLSSDYMTFNESLVLSEEGKVSSLPSRKLISGELELLPGSLETNDIYTAYINATVKDDVKALDSLYITINYKGNENNADCKGRTRSSPTVYAEHPTLGLMQRVKKDLIVNYQEPIDYDLVLTMSEFSMNTSVEITSESGNFSFMTLSDATVVEPVGDGLSIADIPQPVYSSTNAELEDTTVKFDFGFVSVNNSNQNREIKMSFKVRVHDHELLVDGTKHDLVAGMESSRTAEIARLCGTVVKKIEPKLELKVTHDGFLNDSQLFIGDTFTITAIVSHAKNSTGNAIGGKFSLNYAYVEELEQPPFPTVFNLSLGETKAFTWKCKVVEDVYPLAIVPFDLTLTYRDKYEMDMSPLNFAAETKIGTPTLTITPVSTINKIRPGASICFEVEALFEKIKSGAKFEFFSQYVEVQPSLFEIRKFKILKIGNNIAGLNTSASPNYLSTDSKQNRTKDMITIDFGIGSNKQSGDSEENKISFKYCVVLSDHSNTTNGSQYWVGFAMRGNHMSIVHQQLLTAYKPYMSRPLLTASINSTKSSVVIGDEFLYTIKVAHTEESSMFAYNLSLTVFFPDYITVEEVLPNKTIHQKKNHFLVVKIPEDLRFTETSSITLKMKVTTPLSILRGDTSSFPGIVHASYSSAVGKKFIVSSNIKMRMQQSAAKAEGRVETMPRGCKPEYYEFGIAMTVQEVYACLGQPKEGSGDTFARGCYFTKEGENKWKKISSKVGSIVGYDSNNKVYGVSEDCKSYLKHVSVDKWKYIRDNKLPSDVIATFKVLKGSSSGVLMDEADIVLQTAHHKYKVTGDGVYSATHSGESWDKQITHPCLECG